MAELPENDRIAGPFIAAAGQTDFPGDFPLIDAPGDPAGTCVVFVRERAGERTELVLGDFTIPAVADGGFTLRLVSPALAGDRCFVMGRQRQARLREHPAGGAVRSPTLEGDARELAARAQEARRDLDRAFLTPPGESGGTVPAAADRAGRVFGWSADGSQVLPVPNSSAAVASDLLRARTQRRLAELAALAAAADAEASSSDAAAAGTARAAAQAYRDEMADLAASVTAPAPYADEATGRAAVADGAPFWVASPDGLALHFRIDAATVTEPELVLPSSTLTADAIRAVEDNFSLKTATNLADPAITSAELPDVASMLHRVRNAGGVLSPAAGLPGSPSTLGTFAVTPKYRHGGAVPHVVHMHGAPGNASIYQNPVRLDFWNEDGSFHSSLTAGYTVNGGVAPTAGMTGVRQIEFTPPAGSEGFSFIGRNAVDFSNSVPMTEAHWQAVLDNVMLSVGVAAAPFAPYVAAGALEIKPELLPEAEAKPVVMLRQAEYTYYRTRLQGDATKHYVDRVLTGETPGYTASGGQRSGVADPRGRRAIAASTRPEDTIAAFNQSTEFHVAGIDERAPIRMNDRYAASGGHGSDAQLLTMAGHGKTNVDVGSTWSDGGGQLVELMGVVSTSQIIVQPKNTGAADKWVIGGALTGTTLTHVADATNTADIVFTASAPTQIGPLLQRLERAYVVDGKPVAGDGVWSGDAAGFEQGYGAPNLASLQTYLAANVGNPDAPDYASDDISTQVEVGEGMFWDRWGARHIPFSHHVVEAYRRSPALPGAPGGYFGGMQFLPPSKTVDTPPGVAATIEFYAPHISPVGGRDLQARWDMTANAEFFAVPRANCADPANPPAHFAALALNADGDDLYGFLFGYDPTVGVGVPATRATLVENLLYLSSFEKLYPIAVDSQAGDAAAGDVHVGSGFCVPFISSDAELTIPGVCMQGADGTVHCYIAAHQTLSRKWVALPRELVGCRVEVMAGKADANFTLHTDVVTKDGVMISVANGYADTILRIFHHV